MVDKVTEAAVVGGVDTHKDLHVAAVVDQNNKGVNLDIENYCTLRSFFDLPTLAGRSRRNLPEAGIRLLFQI